MAGVNLQAIYNRLAAAPRYHPMSANTFADWTMEAGDIVTVSRDGTGYASPVGTMTMKWNGKQQIQISSEGSKEREPISRVSAREYARGGGGASGMRGSQELYWEMFSEDGQLHAQIHATAEALTSDYSKKIGDVDDALRGVIRQTAERLTIDYTDKISNTESHIEQTAKQIRTSIDNLDDRLSTQINQTDRTVSMSVGRVKYTSVVHKANKDAFPSPGQAGTLYYADDTGRAYLYLPGTHSYELAQVDEYGNANYIKAGEIAISINESGQTEAKLDATRVLAGKGALTIDDLELPDWMDTTEGLIAEKATIVDLNALRARVGTLEADSITTKNMESIDGMFKSLGAKDIAASGSLSIKDGNVYYGVQRSISDLQIVLNGNTYTLQYKKWDDANWTSVSQSFSRATTLQAEYGGDNTGDTATYKVTASPQGNETTGYFTVKQSKTAAYIQDRNGTIRARINNPQYGNGWAAAYGKVSLPSASSTADNFSVSTPPSTVDGAAVATKYTLSNPQNNVAVVKNPAGTIVARLEHGKYNAGFDANHTLVIADANETTQSSISLDPGDTMDIWPGMVLIDGTTKKWGNKVSISVSSGGGGGAGSISIGDIIDTSYPSGTVARQISNLIASTSEDAVQFKVTCTCGAEKTYYIEVP